MVEFFKQSKLSNRPRICKCQFYLNAKIWFYCYQEIASTASSHRVLPHASLLACISRHKVSRWKYQYLHNAYAKNTSSFRCNFFVKLTISTHARKYVTMIVNLFFLRTRLIEQCYRKCVVRVTCGANYSCLAPLIM